MKRILSPKQKALILSRELRRNQTKGEINFWKILKSVNFFGYKFIRQHPLFYRLYNEERFFIADFYCSKLKLVIEIDGGIHEKQADYDKLRAEILESQKNLQLVRFDNDEVLIKPKEILNKLMIVLKK